MNDIQPERTPNRPTDHTLPDTSTDPRRVPDEVSREPVDPGFIDDLIFYDPEIIEAAPSARKQITWYLPMHVSRS